jgi:hypothetical protein
MPTRTDHDASRVRLVEVIASWILLALNLPSMLYPLVADLQDASDPRLIEALAGIGIGIAICFVLFTTWKLGRGWGIDARFAAIIALGISPVAEFFPFKFITWFALLVPALMLAWSQLAALHATEIVQSPPRPFAWGAVVVILGTACSFWMGFENYYTWPAAFWIGSNCIAIAFLAIAHWKNKQAGATLQDAWANLAKIEDHQDHPAGSAAILACTCLGAMIGLYACLARLVTENTAVDNPTRLVYTLEVLAGLVIVIVGSRVRFSSAAWNLVILLPVAFITIGLPWILGTAKVISWTFAGTWHLAGMVILPILGYFIGSRVLFASVSPQFMIKTMLFGTLGLIIGIAGYMFGGNTYNMEPYIGVAFTILVMLGIVLAAVHVEKNKKARGNIVQASQEMNNQIGEGNSP